MAEELAPGLALAVVLAAYTYSTGIDGNPIFGAGIVLGFVKTAGLGLAIAYACFCILRSRHGLHALARSTWCMALPWAMTLISVPLAFTSLYQDYSISKITTTLIGLFSLTIVLAPYSRDLREDGPRRLAKHLLYIFGGFVALGLFSVVAWRGSGDFRWSATLGLIHPNIMAAIIALAGIHAVLYPALTMGGAVSVREQWTRLLIIGGGLAIFGILLSRGAILALAVSGLVVCGYLFRRNALFGIILLFGLFAGSLAIVAFPDVFLAQFSREAGENLTELTGRSVVWQTVMDGMDEVHLFTGYGYGVAFPSFFLYMPGGFLTGAHNSYLQMLTSGGMLAALLFVYMIASDILKSAFHVATRGGYIGFYVLAGVIYIAVHSFSESLFGTNITGPFAVYLCMRYYGAETAVLSPMMRRTPPVARRRSRLAGLPGVQAEHERSV